MKEPALPGPSGMPLIGSLVDFSSDPLVFLRQVASRYGDVASFRLPMGRVVLFNDPEAIRYVLSDTRVFHRSRTYDALGSVLGRGLLTTDGSFHANQRRTMTPLFTRRESLRHADQVSQTGMRVCERLRDGQEVDVLAEMRQAALNVIFQALFGVEVGGRSRDIFGAIDELEETFDNPLFLLWPQFFERMPTGRAKRFRAARATLRTVLGDLVRESAASSSAASPGLVPRMAGSTGSGGTAHADGVLLDHVLTFLLAGHDTTANTLAWAWHLLGKHPKIEAMLQEEWAARLGGRRPNADDLAELRLTDMVIKETLRLYPQAWIQGRRSGASFSWSSYEFSAGTEVMVSAFVTHRDDRFFANPDDFDPLRWDGMDDRKATDFAYFPFGSGIHRCIGEFIAKMESVLLLATIGQNWAFRPTSASSLVAMRPTVTLKPFAGLRMIAHQRHPAEAS